MNQFRIRMASYLALYQGGGGLGARRLLRTRGRSLARERGLDGRRATRGRRRTSAEAEGKDGGSREDGNNPLETARPESPDFGAGGPARERPRRRKADSTDAISSALTRRFGLAGGLVWVGVLAFGVISEQVKTRLEVKREFETAVEVEDAKKVTTTSGLVYQDLKIGGGQNPRKGDLVVVQYKAFLGGVVYEDTKKNTRAGVAFVFGSRPMPPELPLGFEEALSTMKTGGKRVVEVPPDLGFGSEPTFVKSKSKKDLIEIPGNSKITYEIELNRVSIPPS